MLCWRSHKADSEANKRNVAGTVPVSLTYAKVDGNKLKGKDAKVLRDLACYTCFMFITVPYMPWGGHYYIHALAGLLGTCAIFDFHLDKHVMPNVTFDQIKTWCALAHPPFTDLCPRARGSYARRHSRCALRAA